MNKVEQELTQEELVAVEAGCPHPGPVNNPHIPDFIETALEEILGRDL